jgi:hypothetical protein
VNFKSRSPIVDGNGDDHWGNNIFIRHVGKPFAVDCNDSAAFAPVTAYLPAIARQSIHFCRMLCKAVCESLEDWLWLLSALRTDWQISRWSEFLGF